MQAIDELNMLLGIGPPKAKLPLTLERSGYQAVRVLGKGGFGQAHLVFHKLKQQYFVAKQVNLSGMTTKQRKEAHNEITILQQLDHPNIVRYVDYYEEGANLYIVMEYADGGDLFGHLKKVASTGKQLTEEQIMALFTQIAMAIKHMHDRRMLHRDIKAQNVFLTKSHVVKLGDFGISTVLNNTMAMAQTMCGTPCYFSPELCAGKPYNNKSDIWALGVLLFEMCTGGELPFEAANVKSLMDQIVKKTPRRIPKEYSDNLANLVAAMMSKDPRQRPDIDGVLKAPAVVKACPKLLQQLSALCPVAAPRGSGSGPVPPPPARRETSPPPPPPRGPRVPATHHDDAKDVLLAEPPAPHRQGGQQPEPRAARQPPPPRVPDGIAPHRHFADTAHDAAGYQPALLQQAARQAAEDDDCNPNCDPHYHPRPLDDLAQVVANLATMRDQRLRDEVDDEVGPAVHQQASVSHAGASVMTDVVLDDETALGGPQKSVEFDDPQGKTLDEAVLSPMVRKQPAAFGANKNKHADSPVKHAAPMKLSAKQKSVLRDFAARTGAQAPAAAVANKPLPKVAEQQAPSEEVEEDEDEDADQCIGGHCLCGASVYAAWLSNAVGVFTCDCMACRRFSGNVKGCEWIHFPECSFADLLQQSPEARTFVISANAIELYFCGACGGSLAMLHEGIDGCIVARATLSEASAEVFDAATKSA